MQEDVQDEDEDLEVQFIHAERQAYIGRMCPLLLAFLVLALTPRVAHLQICSLIASMAILLTILDTAVMLRSLDKQLLMKRAVCLENINHSVRTSIHVLFLTMHNESVFLRLMSLYLQPLFAAWQCHNIRSFKVFLAVHNVLTIYRFRDDFEEGLPWIFTTVILSSMLLEGAVQKKLGIEARSSLGMAYKTMGQWAETSSLRMLQSFCDAVAIVDKDLNILEPSPSLATVLSRRVNAGTSMIDFIHMSECQQLRDHIADLQEVCNKQSSADDFGLEKHSTADQGKNPEGKQKFLETTKVHLVDGHSGLVAVNLFSVCLMEPCIGDSTGVKYLVGICESWKPRSHQPKSKSKMERAMPNKYEFNIGTGQIEPMFPAFPPKESKAPLRELSSTGQLNSWDSLGATQDGTPQMVQQLSSSLCRRSSPRPANASPSLRQSCSSFLGSISR